MPAAPSPLAIAVAAAIVGAAEQAVLNPLTVLRARAFAGRAVPLRTLLNSASWGQGLPLLLVVQVVRNLVGFGLWAALAAAGSGSWGAGLLAGLADGAIFVPTRRLLFRQHLGAPDSAVELARVIVSTEGWQGLWRGGWLSLARSGLGGAAYFGVLGSLLAAGSRLHPAIVGALATAACTVAVNPLEVALARVYSGRWTWPPWATYWRGMGIALARTVPAKAVSWWAAYGLAGAASGLATP